MSSIFASRVRQTVELPFDPPHTVTIQKLSGRQREKASRESQFASAEYVQRMGGSAFKQQLAALDAETIAKAVAADPLLTLDRLTVLKAGIVGWSYDLAVTPEAIEDLSEEASDFLARAIVGLTSNGTSAAAQKND
jgi:hypothetical protein